MSRIAPRRAAGLLIVAVCAVGCATTTVDEQGDVVVDTAITEPGDPVGTGDPTGASVVGTDADVSSVPTDAPVTVPDDAVPVDDDVARQLGAIGEELSGLGFQISDDGDEDATIALIEERWRAIRDAVDAERPDLTGQFQVTIDMARTAVDRNRPADADKALGLFNVLVDNSGFVT